MLAYLVIEFLSLMIQVFDNYLSPLQHQKISDFLLKDGSCQWKFNDRKVRHGDDPYDYQFTHTFHTFHSLDSARHEVSPQIDYIKPLVEKIRFIALHRIKANLEPIKPERTHSDFHYDVHKDGKPCPFMTTAIYYVNTNDGYTEFETGEKVMSQTNTAVIFDTNLRHRGVPATNVNRRMVLNISYFEK